MLYSLSYTNVGKKVPKLYQQEEIPSEADV